MRALACRRRRSCLARTQPSTTGFTNSRWLGLGASGDGASSRRCRRRECRSAPRWYFTSPRALRASSGRVPSNSAKICASGLPIMFASTLRRPRCAMPITTSRTPSQRRVVQDAVEQRDQRLGALEREALVADVLRVQEAARRSRRRSASRACASARRRRAPGSCASTPSAAAATPALGVGDVHVLDADRAAVGLAQHVEDLAQRRAVPLARETAGDELAVEVPEREAVGRRVEVAVRRARGGRAGRGPRRGGRARGSCGSAAGPWPASRPPRGRRERRRARGRVHLPAHRSVRHAAGRSKMRS